MHKFLEQWKTHALTWQKTHHFELAGYSKEYISKKRSISKIIWNMWQNEKFLYKINLVVKQLIFFNSQKTLSQLCRILKHFSDYDQW